MSAQPEQAHTAVRLRPMTRSDMTAIMALEQQLFPEDAWTPVRYPRALWDDQLGCWVSDVEVAETSYTAFTGVPARGWQHDTPRPIAARSSGTASWKYPRLPGSSA